VKAFLEGQECNAVYDGYSYMPLYLTHSHAVPFSHTWGFEPTSQNHWVPNYGAFAKQYFSWSIKKSHTLAEAYSNFKPGHGPPHNHYCATYDPLEANEYLLEKGVDIDAIKNHHKKDVATQ
jgi:hypothetical protein